MFSRCGYRGNLLAQDSQILVLSQINLKKIPAILMLRSFHLFRKIRTFDGNKLARIIHDSPYEGLEYLGEMPKSKEYLSSEDSDSSVEKAPKRKREKEESKKSSESRSEKAESSKKLKSSSKDNEDETSWEIGNKRVVSVSEFKGRMYINIREMYMDNSGNLKPGKKGIALTPEQWQKLMDCSEGVNKALKK